MAAETPCKTSIPFGDGHSKAERLLLALAEAKEKAKHLAGGLRGMADLILQGKQADMESLSLEYGSLRSVIEAIREALRGTFDSDVDDPEALGFEDFEKAIHQLQQQEKIVAIQNTLSQAAELLQLLDRIRCFSSSEGRRIPEVDDEIGKLRALIESTEGPDIPEPVRSLVNGEHPLAALLHLAVNGSKLSDEEYVSYLDRVRQAYGSVLYAKVTRQAIRLVDVEPDTGAFAAEAPREVVAVGEAAGPVGAEPSDEHAGSGEQIHTVESEDQHTKCETGEAASSKETAQSDHSIAYAGGGPEVIGSEAAGSICLGMETADDLGPSRGEVAPRFFSMNLTGPGIVGIEGRYPEQWLHYSKILHGLILHERLWAAWALARFMETEDIGVPLAIPSWIIRSAAVGTQLSGPEDGNAALLQEDLRNFSESVFAPKQREYNWNIRLLLVAATLRAALVAPQTGAAAVLQGLYLGEARGLHELCRRVADFGQRHGLADTSLMAGLRNLAALQQEKSRVLEEASAWAEQAPALTFKFAAATKVWLRWLEKDRIIWQLTSFAREEASVDRQKLEKAVNAARDDSWFRSEVRKTDRQDNGRVGGRDITADPLEQLRRRMREAVSFAERWLRLQTQQQEWDRAGNFLRQAAKLREELLKLVPDAESEIASMVNGSASNRVLSGAVVCRSALVRFRDFLQPGALDSSDVVDPEDQFLANMLPIAGIEVNPGYRISWCSPQSALQMLESLSKGEPLDWEGVLIRFAEQGDYMRCFRTLEVARRVPSLIAPDLLSKLEEACETHLSNARRHLKAELSAARVELENAVAHGLLNEKHRTELNARLEMAEALCAASLDVKGLLDDASAVREQIRSKERQQVSECRRRLEQALPQDHRARQRILEVLDRGDVLTAHEWIDLILNGNDLPPSGPSEDHFTRFFSRIRDLELRLERRNTPRAIIEAVSHRDPDFDRELIRITGAEASRAASALKTWYEMKRVRRSENEQIREILAFLGFELAEVVPAPGERDRWYKVKTRPLADRRICPVPRYGSLAAGRYMLLCSWDRPNEEVLLREVSEQAQAAVIVFFFGRLTEFRRRNLARLCRERTISCLVLDELLMLYLCSISGLRLPTFFSCTLPLTYARAYVTSAGPLPPEMFYGRREALESIMNPQGTCFIYGGRQLGKTALMKEAQRRFHHPEQERYAVWIDLKASGIGHHSQLDEFWPLAAEELRKAGVKAKFAASCDAEGFASALGVWMEANPERHLLLLLDEADRFLLEDARSWRGAEFTRATALKGLMDRTGRRFKVVFAGLHDVQRTTTLANHPLAHLGVPLCIGPLLEGGEWKEARALIEEPFARLGYRFEDPGLVTRILSQTNYYPSLIQLYCEQIFDHLMRSPASTHDWNSGPPYEIRSSDVEGVYRSQELRRAIRDRVLWTLQLDKRYEVIAYALAYEVISTDPETRARLLSEGLDSIHLQRQSSSWWPEGFASARSVDSFRCLLDEMVGLGILRQIGEGRYGLRSPNVLNLLGTEDEIEARLLEPREPELRYEPSQMRAPMGDPMLGKRSPMTWQQESILRGDSRLFLIIGTAAGGLDDVPERLAQLYGRQPLASVPPGAGLDQFRAELRRQRQELGVIFVPPFSVDWDHSWLKAAQEWAGEHHEDARVIFICDPYRLWQLLSSNSASLSGPVGTGTAVITLAPWADEALRVWLDDCQINASPDDRAAIAAATGNWPAILSRFLELTRTAGSWQQALDNLREQLQAGSQHASVLRQSFGVDHPKAGCVLQHLVELGEAPEQVLKECLTGVFESEIVQKTMDWARMLNIASFGSRNEFQPDLLVSRLLRRP